MQRLRGFFILALAGCSSAGNSPPVGSGPGTVFENKNISNSGAGELLDATVQSTKFVSSASIGRPVDDVWAVLPDIWTTLGITVDGISQTEHRLTSPIMRVRRALGGVPLSRYVECGRTAMGPNADSYFIALKVETVLSGSGRTTIVQSALKATGEGTGNGGQQVRCSSTGELENRIGERLLKRLQ